MPPHLEILYNAPKLNGDFSRSRQVRMEGNGMLKCFFSLVIVFGVIVSGLLLGSPAQATKLVTYSSGDEARAGAVEGSYVIDLNRGYAFYLSDSGAASPETGDALVPPDLLRILHCHRHALGRWIGTHPSALAASRRNGSRGSPGAGSAGKPG